MSFFHLIYAHNHHYKTINVPICSHLQVWVFVLEDVFFEFFEELSLFFLSYLLESLVRGWFLVPNDNAYLLGLCFTSLKKL